jgi:ribosomal protein L7Ae-like RNA K-turn-binding protein|tara:strand:+ start:162 stop:281 length:120 start_codon:yes stop_codon:yes gene_type:complete
MFSTLTSNPSHPSNVASKHKQVKRGVKEVVKALRKDTKG